MKAKLCIVLTILVFSCNILNASASHEFDSFARYAPRRSAQNSGGKIGIFEAESKYSHELKLFGRLPVTLSLGSQYMLIEENVDLKIPSYLSRVNGDLKMILPFFKLEETYICLGVKPSFYSDGWSFQEEDFRLLARSFLIYRPSDRWTFIGGVALYPGFEDLILPIAGFIYKPSDKLIFNITPERPNITYAFNDKLSVFAEGDIALSEYNVDRGGTKDVALKYKGFYAGGGLEFKLNKYIRGLVTAGGTFGRHFRYRDGKGKISIEDGFYTQLKIGARF